MTAVAARLLALWFGIINLIVIGASRVGYKIKPETIAVTLAAPYDGPDGVQVTGLRSVKWKTLSEIALLSEKSDAEKAAGYLPKIEKWLLGWLKGWNIEQDDGQPLPFAEMGELPSDLVIAMFNAMSTALAGNTQNPPAPAPPSTST